MPAWPRVVDALVAILPTLPGYAGVVTVFDGQALGGETPRDFVEIGHVADDSGSATVASAGSWQCTRNPDGFFTDEVGEVNCQFTSWTGDAEPSVLPAIRARVAGFIGALEDELRADQTLRGALGAAGTTDLRAEPLSVKNSNGTAQTVVVTVGYSTYY